MAKFDLVIIATCINSEHIDKMLHSVFINNSSIQCKIGVLVQNRVTIDNKSQYISNNTYLEIFGCDTIVPLSKARNIMLSKLDITQAKYVMFADDDSVFDACFFENFKTFVDGSVLISVKGTVPDLDVFFLRIPEYTRKVQKRDLHYAISVNMIIGSGVVAKVGGFDEELGVGNYYGAGEDNDFFLRCMNITSFKFCPQLFNRHPLQNPKAITTLPLKKLVQRYKSYGRGVVYMLKKNNMKKEALKVVCRGYIGAIISLLKFNFKMCYVYFIAANERLYTVIKNNVK